MELVSAKEAAEITKQSNRSNKELQEIMQYIIEAAQQGKDFIVLYPIIPYYSGTIGELRELGYKVSISEGNTHNRFKRGYLIDWASKELWEE